MIKNTEQENELLKRLNEIEDVILAVRYPKEYESCLTNDKQLKIEEVLKQVKVTYPTVKYPETLYPACCGGSPVKSFITDMIPVYDRLSSQAENEVDDDPDADFYKQLFELPEGTHLIEVKDSEPKELIELIVDQIPENRGIKSKEELTSEPVVGSVEYNAKNVNEVNPFNPIGHDIIEEPKEVKAPAKRGRKVKNK